MEATFVLGSDVTFLYNGVTPHWIQNVPKQGSSLGKGTQKSVFKSYYCSEIK